MAPQIPTQFQFRHLLSHAFPGFFSAITAFMLIDLLSPFNLTLWAIKNIESLVTFIGFVALIGSILGIIIDSLNHWIIEDNIFDKFIEIRKIKEFSRALAPQADVRLHPRSYFFKKVDKPIDIDEYMLNIGYCYYEFYANTFISLIPFSVIAPFYLFYVLQIPWSHSLLLALISFFVAVTSLKGSYIAFKRTWQFFISTICGYLDRGSYIHVKRHPPRKYGNSRLEVKIEAEIIDKVSQTHMFGSRIVNFKTTLGEITPKEATVSGRIAESKLTLDLNRVKTGIAIVTATSENCLPGVAEVRF